jgi:hypothetical protein
MYLLEIKENMNQWKDLKQPSPVANETEKRAVEKLFMITI